MGVVGYDAKKWDTSECDGIRLGGRGAVLTNLELSRPNLLGRVVYETASKVSLHTTNEVVVFCMRSLTSQDKSMVRRHRETSGRVHLRDNTKGMVLHDSRATHTGKEALLHSAPEPQDSNLGRGLEGCRR